MSVLHEHQLFKLKMWGRGKVLIEGPFTSALIVSDVLTFAVGVSAEVGW